MWVGIIAPVLTVAVPFGAVAWAVWRGRVKARALSVQADIQWVVDRALGGASLISVEAAPRTPWRPGRVVVSVPADWQRFLDSLWSSVLRHVPPGYELVVPGAARGHQPVEPAARLKRAA